MKSPTIGLGRLVRRVTTRAVRMWAWASQTTLMAPRRLHLVEAEAELFQPLVVADRFAEAAAVGANRGDDDLHEANIDCPDGRWKLAVLDWVVGLSFRASEET